MSAKATIILLVLVGAASFMTGLYYNSSQPIQTPATGTVGIQTEDIGTLANLDFYVKFCSNALQGVSLSLYTDVNRTTFIRSWVTDSAGHAFLAFSSFLGQKRDYALLLSYNATFKDASNAIIATERVAQFWLIHYDPTSFTIQQQWLLAPKDWGLGVGCG